MSKILSTKSLKSKKSTKSTTLDNEEQVNFELAVGTTAKKFGCAIDIVVNKITTDDFRRDKSLERSRCLVSATDVTDNSDTTYYTQSATLILTAYFSPDNRLYEVIIERFRYTEIPRDVIQVLGIIFPAYPRLTKFTIENCRINHYTIHELSKILANTNITDVCLDSSVLSEANYKELLLRATALRNLSLKRCKINDQACQKIFSELHRPCHAESLLLSLDLSSNVITDEGAKFISEALRNNRHLRVLNLAGNQITDEGASYIFNVLKEFPLTYDEIINKRTEYFKYLKDLQDVYNKLKKDSPMVGKFIKKKGTAKKGSQLTGEQLTNSKADLVASELLGPFIHPYNKAYVTVKDGYLYSKGNLVLCYINLAYNNLTYSSVLKLREVLDYQDIHRNNNLCGLLRVVIEGNSVPRDCGDYAYIENIFDRRIGKGKPQSVALSRRKSTLNR